MLAVKKLCDIQRALLQAETGPGTLRRKAPRALQLVAIEAAEGGGDGSAPHTPRMQTFQDSELSAELQTAMSNHAGACGPGLALRSAVGMSHSQESIDTRSRGSGRSQDPMASSTPHSCSQESLDSSAAKERDLPEGYDQRPLQQQLKQVPLGTATVFKYPAVPAKPRGAGTSSLAPCGPALKGLSYLHSHSGSADMNPPLRDEERRCATPSKGHGHAQGLTRCALSDGEPEEDEDEPVRPPGHLSSYATLTRKPGRSQLARLPSSPERNVGRSQSFAVRARKKGPPPPPPKRLSSVSSSTSGDLSDSSADTPPGGAATGSLSVRTIAASLEGRTDGEKNHTLSQNPPPSSSSAAGPGSREGSGLRRRVQSECISTQTSSETDQGVRSDSEEEEPKVGGLKGSSSPNSSSECIPFAEEGNLTIKQRPKAPGPPRAEAVLEPPENPPVRILEVPEFNLKESDTVKRRHKPKDKEPDGGCHNHQVAAAPETTSRVSSQSQEEVRVSHACLEAPAAGSPVKPALPSKPPAIAPKPVRHSLLAAQGKNVGLSKSFGAGPVDPGPGSPGLGRPRTW